ACRMALVTSSLATSRASSIASLDASTSPIQACNPRRTADTDSGANSTRKLLPSPVLGGVGFEDTSDSPFPALYILHRGTCPPRPAFKPTDDPLGLSPVHPFSPVRASSTVE